MSMPVLSTSTGMAPMEVTQSAITSAPTSCAALQMASPRWKAPAEVSACTYITTLGFSRRIKSAASWSAKTSPQGFSKRTSSAPWRRAISDMRSQKKPLANDTTFIPGKTKLEWPLFQEQIKGNRLILAAQNSLANHPPDYDAAKKSVESFIRRYAPERSGRQFLASIMERLAEAPSDRRDCLELQADISRLSPTSHIISRTRKIEALPNRPKRDPHWQRVHLNEEEREIYESVEEICRKQWPGTADSWGFQMSLMM